MAYTFTRTGAQIEEIHNTVDDLPSIVSNENLISNSSFEIAGSVTNPPGSTPRSYNAGDELFSGFKAVGALSGVTYINGKLNGTGQLYVDIFKTEKQKLSTAPYVASIASSDGVAVESGALFVDNGDYWRVTFDMTNTFSVKFEQGKVATGHEVQTEKGQDYSFNSVADMIAIGVPIGAKCSTGGTKWKRVTSSAGGISDYIVIGSKVQLEEFITDDETEGFYFWLDYISSTGNFGAARSTTSIHINADSRSIDGDVRADFYGAKINVQGTGVLLKHSGGWFVQNVNITGNQDSYILEPLDGWSCFARNMDVSECRGFALCDDVGGRVFGNIEFLNCSGHTFQSWCLLQCGGLGKLKFKGGAFDNDGFESTGNARVCYVHSGPSTATVNDGVGDVFFDEVEVINLTSSNDAAEVQACQVNKAKRFFARDNTIIGLEKTGTTSGNCEGLYSQDLLFTRFKNNDVIDCECAQGSLVIKQRTKNAKISGGTIKPKVGGKLSNGIIVTNTSELDDRSVSVIDVDIIEPYGIGINVVTGGLQTGLTLNLTNNTITDWHGVSGIFINYGRECDLTCRNKLKTTRDTPTLTDNPIFGTIPSALTGVYGAVMIVVPADAAAETLINLEGNEIKAPTTTDYHGIVVYGVGSVSSVQMLYSNTTFLGVDSPVWWDIENSTLLGSDLYHKDCGNYTLKHNASGSMITGLGFGYGTVTKVATILTGQVASAYLSRDEREVTTFDSGWTVSQTSGTPLPHKLDLTTGQVRVVIDSPAPENITFNIQKQTDIRRTISATS